MSTSCIGDISIIEVYGNIFSVYFMLEELKNKSREKYHNVVVEGEEYELHITCQHLEFC
jgi:hypothetical protein